MATFVETIVGEGDVIKIEVESASPTTGVVPAARPQELAARMQDAFSEVMRTIQTTSKAFAARIRELTDSPDKVEIDFGVKVDFEAGAMIAKSGMEANYLVKLTWNKPPARTNLSTE